MPDSPEPRDPFGDRISVVQDDPGPHDPNHPGHIPAADRVEEALSAEEEAELRRRLARSNGPDDDVGYAVFGWPGDAEDMAARLLATLDRERLVAQEMYRRERAVSRSTAPATARTHEETCQRCGGLNLWSWTSDLWNQVMRGPSSLEDRWSVVCPRCFSELAESEGVVPSMTVWHLSTAPATGPGLDVDYVENEMPGGSMYWMRDSGGREFVSVLRRDDVVKYLRAATEARSGVGLDMPRCILDHDHGHDEGDCVYEGEARSGVDDVGEGGEDEWITLVDDVRYAGGNGTSDYWRGFNDGIDKLADALRAATEARSGVDEVGELREALREALSVNHGPFLCSDGIRPCLCAIHELARAALATTQPERRDGA